MSYQGNYEYDRFMAITEEQKYYEYLSIIHRKEEEVEELKRRLKKATIKLSEVKRKARKAEEEYAGCDFL